MTRFSVAATWRHDVARLAAVERYEFLGPACLWLCRQGHLDAAHAAGSEVIDRAPFVVGPFPLAQAHCRKGVRVRSPHEPSGPQASTSGTWSSSVAHGLPYRAVTPPGEEPM